MNNLEWYQHLGSSQTCRISSLVILHIYYEDKEYRFSINNSLESKHGYPDIQSAKEAVIKATRKLLKQTLEVIGE